MESLSTECASHCRRLEQHIAPNRVLFYYQNLGGAMADYTTDPPVASAGSLMLLSDKMTDMCQKIDKLGDIPQKLDRLDMTITQLSKDHQQTRADLLQTQTNFQSELEKIQRDVGELKTSKTRIDTLGEWFKWGGIALVSGIVGSWYTLSNDVRDTQSKTANNDQRIMIIEKQGDQTSRILDEIRNKLYERNYMSDTK